MLHRSSFILLSKCKKGENLLLFEVISLKTAEERWIHPQAMEMPARVSFSQATLCASQSSAFVSPRVPQSSSALPALCGDTDGSGAAAPEQQQRSSSGAAPEQQQQRRQRLSGVGPAGGHRSGHRRSRAVTTTPSLRSTRRPGQHTRLWASPDAFGAALSWREKEIYRKKSIESRSLANRAAKERQELAEPRASPASRPSFYTTESFPEQKPNRATGNKQQKQGTYETTNNKNICRKNTPPQSCKRQSGWEII